MAKALTIAGTVAVVVALGITIGMGLSTFAKADNLIELPDGVTLFFDGPNIGFRVYGQCDHEHGVMLYVHAAGIVAVKGGC